MGSQNIVFLSGGTGTPKLLQGAKNVIDTRNITVIGNTGDDWNFYGLYVSPDIDSVLFTLSNMINSQKWWGIQSDTFMLTRFLRDRLKEEIWFNLGDYDAGLCLFRSYLLDKGKSLTKATDIIKNRLNIKSTILPMVDQPIQTQIRTAERIMHLQEFWVKYRGTPQVINVFFQGDLQKTTPQVLNAIETAEIIIFGPSNPVSSIGPILAVTPIRKALQEASGKRIAISPIIGDQAISGPTAAFLKAWGKSVSPSAIVELYHDVLDDYIINKTDTKFQNTIKELDVNPIFEDIIINTPEDAERLITRILDRI
ncbi:MAG: 2-phospho-L-lactate transferase [Candidatus Hodarchaeota archaeon]